MVKKRLLAMCFMLLLVLASGCTGTAEEEKKAAADEKPKQADASKKPAEEKEDDLDFSPYETTKAEERILLEPGEYSGDNYDEEKVKKAIGQFPEGKTAEEYYSRTLALVAEDYRPFHEIFENMDTAFAEPSAEPGEMDSIGTPEGKHLNVQILFDASGSMAAQIGGVQMMKLAKDAVKSFASDLPENTNVSLRVYGHQGTGSDADKQLSCSSTEEVYPFSPYDEEAFTNALDQFSPAGWTPLGASLEAAYEDLLSHKDENAENIVYVVSDGVETCGGDPVAAAKKLNESDIQAIVNIIGFDVDDAGQQALKKVAEAGKGEYSTVRSKQEFDAFFRKEKSRLLEEWHSWQNENVSNNFASMNDRVTQMFEAESGMVSLAQGEENRLVGLSDYIGKQFDVDSYEIRKPARDMGLALRDHARQTALNLRMELRDKGLENRMDIRNKGIEERQKLRSRRE